MAKTGIKIDREKYYQIAKTQGLSAAITALHKEKNEWEHTTFEGPDGYRRDLWDALEEFRTFSRELWDMALKDPNIKQ